MKNIAIELGLASETNDVEKYADAFEDEMLRGLRGEESSLLMLPTYICQEELASALDMGEEDFERGGNEGANVAVIDAGGTNLRIALVGFAGGAPNIRRFAKYPVPGSQKAVSAEEFFDALAVYLEPIISQSDRIGFCFSNPAEILPNKDAKIITFTKEVQVSGAAGTVLGESLNEALRRRGAPHGKKIVVLNDTVATHLSAMANPGERKKHAGHIGLILGTGINASYPEQNSAITKNDALRVKSGATVINTEAGGFDKFPQNEVDSRFMAATADPSYHRFEKMASGAYQYALLLEWIRHAADLKAFSSAFSERLGTLASIPIGDADLFLFGSGDDALTKLCASDADARGLRQLIEAFFDRIAFMTAAMLTGILKRMGETPKDPERPVCISAEGTTFYNAKLLRPGLERHMKAAAADRLGLNYEFTRIENATIIGSAVAGLTA
ncbi:MAG: hexokinase [Clostridiales Family XIII bacterium]|jgi:hexokinase|nr:hexokinase [Clostridiales Family XIII bacterium]